MPLSRTTGLTRYVPTQIRRESQNEHQPPKHKQRSHPKLIPGDPQFLRQDVRSRRQQHVPTPRVLSQFQALRVGRRQRVEKICQASARNLLDSTCAISDGIMVSTITPARLSSSTITDALTPRVPPETPSSRQHRSDDQPRSASASSSTRIRLAYNGATVRSNPSRLHDFVLARALLRAHYPGMFTPLKNPPSCRL